VPTQSAKLIAARLIEARLIGLGLALLVLVTWPLVLSPLSAIPGEASLEATEHLWLLWLGASSGGLSIESEAVAFPGGFSWVLGDPLNLLWFVPGNLIGGPALGFNLVHWASLAIAGLAAVWLGRELLGEDAGCPALTLVAAISLPVLCGGLANGMTEAQTVGWAGLSLAALHRALRTGKLRDELGAGVLFGLTAWGGPYPLIHAALLAPFVAGFALWRLRPDPLRAARSLFRVAGPAALLCAPVLSAIFEERASDQPGSTDHSADILADPTRNENLSLGADPLQLLLPTEADHEFEVYLGTVFVLLALVGALRLKRAAGVLLVPALVGMLLSIGLYLHLAGSPIGPDTGVYLAPAGMLTELVEPLGRAPRWYRMAMLSGLLLAPLAAVGIGQLASLRPGLELPLKLGLPALLLADALLLAPADWPRPLLDGSAPDGADQLQGPLLELPLPGQQGDGPPPQEMGIEVPPPVRTASLSTLASRAGSRLSAFFSPESPLGGDQGVGAFRSRSLLWQTHHEQALGTNPYLGAGPEARDQAGVRLALAVEKAQRDQRGEQITGLLRQAREEGFTGLLFYPGPHSSQLEALLREQLGEPGLDGAQIKSWSLDGAATGN
jgi:hypothetical protein